MACYVIPLPRPEPYKSFLITQRAILLLGMKMVSDTLLPDKTIALLSDIFLPLPVLYNLAISNIKN
jgi:hypothetical protein